MGNGKCTLSAPVVLAVIVLLYSLSQLDISTRTETGFKPTSSPLTEGLVIPESSAGVDEEASRATPEQVAGVQDSDPRILVKHVIDGDTVALEDGRVVRYIGIDTPETSHPSKGIQCFGEEAKIHNAQLVEGKYVRMEKDISETDRYNRLLRYVFVGDVFVNDVLVRDGYAYSYTYPPDIRYQDTLREAEREARQQDRGLWGTCRGSSSIQSPVPTSSVALKVEQAECSSNTYNCSDFNSQAEAQAIFYACGGLQNDVHKLDQDQDGQVCESLP